MKLTRGQLKSLIKEFVDTAAMEDIDTSNINIEIGSDENLKEESVQVALLCIPEKYKKYITDDIIEITRNILDRSTSSLSNLSESKKEKKKLPKHLEGLDLNEFGISDDLITGNKLIFKDQDPNKGFASDEEIRAAVIMALIDHLEENSESMDSKVLRATIDPDFFKRLSPYYEERRELQNFKTARRDALVMAGLNAIGLGPVIAYFYIALFSMDVLMPLKRVAGSESLIFEATSTGMQVVAVYLFFMMIVWGYYTSMKTAINKKESQDIEYRADRLSKYTQRDARKLADEFRKAPIDTVASNKEIGALQKGIRASFKGKKEMDDRSFHAGFSEAEIEFINSEVDRLISEKASSQEFEAMIKEELENNPELQQMFAQRRLESEKHQQRLEAETQEMEYEHYDYLVDALDKIDNMIKIKKRLEDVKKASEEELKNLGITGEKFNEELQDIEDLEDAKATVARFKEEMDKKSLGKKVEFMRQQQRRF